MPATDLSTLRELAEMERDPSYLAHGWFPPQHVALDGTALRFSRELNRERLLLPRDGLLKQFANLETATPREIGAFAKRWGRLYLCEHGLPASHHAFVPHVSGPPMTYSPQGGGETVSVEISAEGWGAHEPVANWRYIARRFAGTLEAAATLHVGNHPTAQVWERAGGRVLANYVRKFGLGRRDLLTGLSSSLANLQLAIVAPRLSLGSTGMAIGGSGLPVALAMQLAFAVTRQETGFFPCSEPGCTNPALRPRRNSTPYCEEHLAAGVRNRDAQRRHNARKLALRRAGR